MRILLTGATGYIGKRLLSELLEKGNQVICCVRDRSRLTVPGSNADQVTVIEVDFLDKSSLAHIPKDIDAAYYLMHSMSSSRDYQSLELTAARNFREIVETTRVEQVIYLSGIINEKNLSKHLSSRMAVENELSRGNYHLTTFRAGIIIGSGSASFEIIRDLVEKLPAMVTPKWLKTRCQPIAINDVISFLTRALLNKATYDRHFDIGGPDVISYKQMLLTFAKVRGLKRKIAILPVMTPRLSSYWLYFVTSTSYKLAIALVNSMKVEVICNQSNINQLLNVSPMGYEEALISTLFQIKDHSVISSWKDAMVSGEMNLKLSQYAKVPVYGCFVDKQEVVVADVSKSKKRIWTIGGDNGWYHANTLWKFRGFIDRCFGGVGLRRGRRDANELEVGDAVDFWRVLDANKEENRLLLFAEMKLPGEAWLEFRIKGNTLSQTATFRPKGLWGRLYWYAVLPFHGIIFKGMIRKLSASGGAA